MTAHHCENNSRSGIRSSIVVVVLLIAVVDKWSDVMQAPSAARIAMLFGYTLGLAAACFSLWQLKAHRPGELQVIDGDTPDKMEHRMQPGGKCGH